MMSNRVVNQKKKRFPSMIKLKISIFNGITNNNQEEESYFFFDISKVMKRSFGLKRKETPKSKTIKVS